MWLGREREKRVLELSKRHMDKIVEVVRAMRRTIHAFCDSDREGVADAFKEAFEAEREADKLEREIIEELSKGIFHPINREEVIRLILAAEDIADNAKAASRKTSFIQLGELDEDLNGKLKHFSDLLLEAAERTNRALEMLIKKPSEVLPLARAVEECEEEVDDFRVKQVIPKLLAFCDQSKSLSTCLMLKEMMDNMENVADRCEDVADVIMSIAVSAA